MLCSRKLTLSKIRTKYLYESKINKIDFFSGWFSWSISFFSGWFTWNISLSIKIWLLFFCKQIRNQIFEVNPFEKYFNYIPTFSKMFQIFLAWYFYLSLFLLRIRFFNSSDQIKMQIRKNSFKKYFLRSEIYWNISINLSIKISKATPVGIYLLKVNNRKTRTSCEICSKLTIVVNKWNKKIQTYWYKSSKEIRYILLTKSHFLRQNIEGEIITNTESILPIFCTLCYKGNCIINIITILWL